MNLRERTRRFVDMNPHTTQGGLTVQGAADRARVDTTTIRDAIAQGSLAAREIRILELHPADVDAWATSREAVAK